MLNDEVENNVQKRTFWESLIIKKFEAPAVIIFAVLSSLFLTFVIARGGYQIGIVIICGLIALPLAYATVAYPKFGIVTLIILAFFINYPSRFLPENTPIGLTMDVWTYLLLLGLLIKMKHDKQWAYFKNPITYFLLAWLAYNMFEIINPSSPSIFEWIFTVRTVAFIMLMYFVFLYHIRTKEFIKYLIKIWLALDVLAAISGIQQEFFGLFPFEHSWLFKEPGRFKLLFIAGHLRKWAIFSDPVVFAYNMVAAALLCIALMFGPLKFNRKVILGCLASLFLFVMLYTGTRASFIILPAGILMLFILKLNRHIFIFSIISGLFLLVLIKVPTSNATLARFQSAFKPSKDASFEERAKNQEAIRPYILSHPIGGGLGSVGVWGQRFAPNSYLAKFPPDSGYVRVAVELGWIGLLLYCVFNFVIMYKGIQYYYVIKDPELKTYCLGMVLFIFAFDVGNYPQQALVQYPSNILFFLAMAILNITMRLDIAERKLKPDIKTS
ncbi:O-antigen ligase family protein [Mucilaginibacter sp.]|uniref:O-antigen ligase family protein n=1 Tax=Mucilaginibacter sp. TaxID=1882438 RepID=UPI00283CC05B|nr:O-antigen ligase family protein [Mucilaginibacter sp.]MDR3696126.1 O-antigen ligase family protein [Mucilaginibacter sp.]